MAQNVRVVRMKTIIDARCKLGGSDSLTNLNFLRLKFVFATHGSANVQNIRGPVMQITM